MNGQGGSANFSGTHNTGTRKRLQTMPASFKEQEQEQGVGGTTAIKSGSQRIRTRAHLKTSPC